MAFVAASSLVIASETHGVWTTQAGKDGGYLEVTLGPCDSDSTKTCGTIWDPEDSKTYKSKMHLKGDMQDVEGCISFFCSGQDWKRVK